MKLRLVAQARNEKEIVRIPGVDDALRQDLVNRVVRRQHNSIRVIRVDLAFEALPAKDLDEVQILGLRRRNVSDAR